MYRRDLFDDPKEKAAFKGKYGYDLAAPATYDQLRDIAEFFTRPDQKSFGIALYGSEDYDARTSAFLNLFWSFGAELWDPKTSKAEGYINSPHAKKALSFFKELFAYAPSGSQGAYVPEVNQGHKSGPSRDGNPMVLFLQRITRRHRAAPPGWASLRCPVRRTPLAECTVSSWLAAKGCRSPITPNQRGSMEVSRVVHEQTATMEMGGGRRNNRRRGYLE